LKERVIEWRKIASHSEGNGKGVLIIAVALTCVEEGRTPVEETRAAVFEEFTEDSPGIGLEFNAQWHGIDREKDNFVIKKIDDGGQVGEK
jgi:hypothetical protein